MTTKPLTTSHWVIAIGAVAALSAWYAFFISLSPWPFVGLGAMLLIVSFLLPKAALEGVSYQKGSGMEIISKWDESNITTAVHTTLVSQGAGAVSTLLSGILSRFVDGQNAETFKKRTAFINTQIEYVEKWTKLQIAAREAGRTWRKEDLKDNEIQKGEKGLDHELELGDLKHKLEMEELNEKIEDIQRRRTNSGKEPPITPPPPPPPSPKEVRETRIAELRTREANLLAEKKRADENTNLTEDQRQRIHNNIDDQLALVYEELAELL